MWLVMGSSPARRSEEERGDERGAICRAASRSWQCLLKLGEGALVVFAGVDIEQHDRRVEGDLADVGGVAVDDGAQALVGVGRGEQLGQERAAQEGRVAALAVVDREGDESAGAEVLGEKA